jgi:actin-related protein
MTLTTTTRTILLTTNQFQDRELIPVGLKDYYTGEEVQQRRGMLSLLRPVQRGSVKDWAAVERLWEAAFDRLEVSPSDQPVLLSDPPLNPTANRERMAQVSLRLNKTAEC